MLVASPRYFQTGASRHTIRREDDPSRCAAALHAAARAGNCSALKSVLAGGASPNERSGDKRGALHAASQAGSSEAVAILIRAGAEINMRSLWDITPLLEAAAEGHISVTELLLSAGGDPTAAGRDGFSPLHKAAEMGHVGVVELLLRVMPDADTRNAWGYTPLITAACKGHTAVVRALLRAGADPNVAVNYSAGVVTPLEGAVLQDYAAAARALLEAGSDPNRVNPSTGEAPLHMACAHFSRRCVRALLEFGADEGLHGGRSGGNDGGKLPASVLGRNLRTSHPPEEMEIMRCEIQGMLADAPRIRREARWQRRGWLVCLRALRLQSRVKLGVAAAQNARAQLVPATGLLSGSKRPAADENTAAAMAMAPAFTVPAAPLPPQQQQLLLQRQNMAAHGGRRPREGVGLAEARAATVVAMRLDDNELFSIVASYL